MRTVSQIHPAYRDDIADLVTRRPVPGPGLDQVDPFLFLNHHGPQVYPPNNNGLPFGPHPHRGFETVTFVLEGELAHYDSGGHESVIGAGGVQWMTAGAGLVHAEVSPPEFKRDGGPLEILQLWVNLPARLKMTPPRYSGLQREQIPLVPLPGGAGELLERLLHLAVVREHDPVLGAVALDLDLEPLGQSVAHAYADPVQAAGDTVGRVLVGLAELAARVQGGKDHLDRRNLLLGMDVDRNAAAVVDDLGRSVLEQCHRDVAGEAGQALVGRVVDDLDQGVIGVDRVGVHPRPVQNGRQIL